VAISPPVRLIAGVTKLDEFYRAPLAWPATERAANLENTFLKVADLSKTTLSPRTSLPFDAIESQFLIGLNFRFVLRDVIYASQRRHNQGVLHHSLLDIRRNPAYQEILQYSYEDYFDKFVIPWYQTLGLAQPVRDTLEQGDNCRSDLAASLLWPGPVTGVPRGRPFGQSRQSARAKSHCGGAGGFKDTVRADEIARV